MEEQTDKTFIKNFSLIVVALVVFTIAIAFLANIVGHKDQMEAPSRSASTNERIKPVAGAYTSETAAAIEEAAQKPAARAAVAFDGSLDAEMIYTNVCAACHATAVLGAPKPGSPEMAQRAENGMDVMMQNALNGVNATMPPRGGRPDLSDEQVRAVIEFMLK